MPNAQAGVAAAIASTSRQIGTALGVAVVGSVLASSGGSLPAQFASSGDAAWWVITAAGCAVLVLGLLTTGRRASATARRTAHLVADEPMLVA
jgi:Na+/melibiose symporter-like transporter